MGQEPNWPQRWQAGVGSLRLEDSELTAKTLSSRSVCFEPHCGQAIGSVEVIDLTSLSNLWPHLAQVYS